MIQFLAASVHSLALMSAGAITQVAMPRRGAADAPAISDCGGASVANPGSTVAAGGVTEGRWATGCTITFKHALLNGHCTIASPTGGTITACTDPVAAELIIRNIRDTQNTIVWNCR